MAADEREGAQQQPLPAAQPPRPSLPADQLINVAVQFLNNPEVRKASLDKRKEFLRKRGLSELQIDEALRQSADGLGHASSIVQSPDVPGSRPWVVYGVLLGIIASAGVGLYNVYEMYILPYIQQRDQEQLRLQQLETAVETTQTTLTSTVDNLKTSISAIQNSIHKVEQDVATLKASTRATNDREQSLSEVRADIRTVKSLLLSRNQFASTPVQRTTIPAWQRASGPSSTPNGSAALLSQQNGVSGADAAVTSRSPSLSPITTHSNPVDSEQLPEEESRTSALPSAKPASGEKSPEASPATGNHGASGQVPPPSIVVE